MRKEEIGKYLVKLQLCEARDRSYKQIGPFNEIVKVGEKKEYNLLPAGFNSLELSTMNNDEIEDICDETGIKNSIYRSSADIIINDCRFKLINVKLPSIPIVKNITRDKIELLCSKVDADILAIDKYIDKYWNLRENGSIGEEIENNSENSPFKGSKEHLSKLIEYFLFTGDEKGEYKLKADKLLFFSKPLNPESWKIIDKEKAVDELWNRMKISLKHQGMPSKYPNNKDNQNNESIDIWSEYLNDRYVGALNIRI
ncbi:MAG: hypothetical protein JEY94_03850 [Melioribacteraceae bacterium]|nr:hypothetical protein [Melioribacteraceae bacterium]